MIRVARHGGRREPRALLERDGDRMVTFYDYPEAHWQHLRTRTLSRVPSLRCGCEPMRLNATRKWPMPPPLLGVLLMVAEKRFRKLNAPHLMTDVYVGERYEDGSPVEQRKKIAA